VDDERQPIGTVGLVWVPLACWAGVRLLAWAVASSRSAVRGVPLEDAVHTVLLDPLSLAAIQLAVFGGVLVGGLSIYERARPMREVLAIRPVPVRVALAAVVAGLALQLPLAELSNLAQELQPIPLEQQLLQRELVTPDGAFDAIAILLALVVVAPLTEELVFRGLLLPGLAERYGLGFALFTSALAFGLVHGSFAAIPYATVAGLALGAVRFWTKSLLPAIALHSAVNAVPLLLPQELVAIRGFNTVSEDVYHVPWPLLLASSVVAAIALVSIARAGRTVRS
jgi:membrane protease YdiL (CAAX protease family)